MTAPISRSVQKELLWRIAAAPSVFCFLDYDGTLSPLAPTPDEAVALPGTSAVVRELAALPGMHVALVTGRPIADMRRFLDIPGIHYVGIHGVEVRLPSGETQAAEGIEAARAVLQEIKQQLQQAVSTRQGILIEDKGAALACHYRLATPADGAAARKAVAGLAHAHQRDGAALTLVQGHEVTELRPAHVNKGKAACALLAAYGDATLPLYIGDDQTDEDAFALLPPESITVRVAPPGTRTRARYLVPEPSAVHRFLRAVLESRAEGLPPETRSR